MAFIANFIRFSAVQKFWKSIKIWQSYRQFKGGTFFWDTVYIQYITELEFHFIYNPQYSCAEHMPICDIMLM